nr:TlpA disulfide reductase family protein [uncultured Draconibacterium sp.]
MNKLIYLVGILITLSCSSNRSKPKENQYDKLEKITITGTVQNFDSGKDEIQFYVNRIGFSSEVHSSKLDSLGNFSVVFESYVPTDVWLTYKMNFLVLTKPGDSIHVIFDGSSTNRPDILNTIKYSGDAEKMNKNAAIFQKVYFSDSNNNNFSESQEAKKNLGYKAYLEYLETRKQKNNTLLKKFISEESPDEETRLWAQTLLEQDYYDALTMYPFEHQMLNQLQPNEWKVPLSYYKSFPNRFPINKDMLISGYALSGFVNKYNAYLSELLSSDKVIAKYKSNTGRINPPAEIIDSVIVQNILNYTPDSLVKQMVLTEFFVQSLEANKIGFFENCSPVINRYITEPFLKEPLLKEYNKVKKWIANPEIASDALLKNMEESSSKQIMDSILIENKGNVIYLDCWATWCGPCRTELPESKKLMEELQGKDVAFVFLCIDSEEKGWKAILSEFQLGGQHYFLTPKQSTDIRKNIGIQGIPYYLLIDKQGIIRERGSHLRPNSVTEKIEKLINK